MCFTVIYFNFQVAETYGDETISIRETALLVNQGISGYIGPQETCIHEGRIAAAFNLPMISYVSTVGVSFVINFERKKKLHFETPKLIEIIKKGRLRAKDIFERVE